MPTVVQPIWVYETDVVDIHWRLKDGRIFVQRVVIPPPATREVRMDVDVKPEDA